MSITGTATPNPVHIPKKADRFEFDEEVSRVFDNMALRSIPLYVEARKLTVAIAVKRIKDKLKSDTKVTVVDIGASTGAFFKDLWWGLGYSPSAVIPNLECIAVDSSKPMLDQLSRYMPQVERLVIDARDIKDNVENVDICNLAYVTQFMEPSTHYDFYYDVHQVMKDGGLLISSQKDRIDSPFRDCFTGQYIEFRRENGYSNEEIEAKTKALKGSMWPQTYYHTVGGFTEVGFIHVQEVCRWLQFSTIVALR